MPSWRKIKWKEGSRKCQRKRKFAALKKVGKGITDKVTRQRIWGRGVVHDRGNSKYKDPEAESYLTWSRNGQEASVAKAE